MNPEISLKEIKTSDEKMIEFKNYESILVVEDAKSLRVTVNHILKSLQENPVIYINLINTYNSLISNLKKDEIKTDNIFFIDCITQLAGGDVSEQENVLFIRGAPDLTSLEIAISQLFERIPGEKWLVLYAMRILKIYNKEDTVLRFIQSILGNASRNNAKIVVLSTKLKDARLIKKAAQFFEKVVMEVE